MADHTLGKHQLATRPDRIDFRDRMFTPRLQSLPPRFPADEHVGQFLDLYMKHNKILDQKREGACTGFGLAAVVNFIIWEQWLRSHDYRPPSGEAPPPNVSERMLYDLARVYDEWEGEDYSGSSCRGAMKGWHKHGVCAHGLWPRDPDPAAERDQWRKDAPQRPLGAYYRVEAGSIADMQAAIHEVRAVYCSARVHAGWDLERGGSSVVAGGVELPVIPYHSEISGGHAFALVGYTDQGFIVQNSWGKNWGYNGFALLTYQDWLKNGNDAWVSAMAAPITWVSNGTYGTVSAPIAMATEGLASSCFDQQLPMRMGRTAGPQMWTPDDAHLHSVILGNDGKILRRLIAQESAEAALDHIVSDQTRNSIESGVNDIVVYAHGGLNSEDAALERARILGPWFRHNNIHPIFVNWRTSVAETIGSIGADITDDFLKAREKLSEGFITDLLKTARNRLQSQFDKAFEVTAEKTVGKLIWSQMKQNAKAAANGKGGTRRILLRLRELKQQHPHIRIHLLGHSAGSILLGQMARDFKAEDGLTSVGLFAPACTLEFAIKTYGRLLEQGVLDHGKLFVENLNDELERNDTVGPYGKSLLYLVSRALESTRNVPLLGLEKAWLLDQPKMLTDPDTLPKDWFKGTKQADFDAAHLKHIARWNEIASEHGVQFTFHENPQATIRKKAGVEESIDRAHGSFDNDIDLIQASIWRITGNPPPHPVDDLTGF